MAWAPGGVHRIMERELRDQHEIENRRRAKYDADHGDPAVVQTNQDRQPRSQVVLPERSGHSAPREVTPARGSGDDLALNAFPALDARFKRVEYPDNFKPNIKSYDGRSDPNIWLSTYYVTVKAAGGGFDHMTAYFPLVMGKSPSLWLNNLEPGSIKT